MAELTIADIQQLLVAVAESNRATAEAGQINANRITELHTTLDKLAASQQEVLSTSTCMESTPGRVIQANTALDRSVADLKQSMERVVSRVHIMERTAATLSTPEYADLCPGLLRPDGHRSSNRHQGVSTEEDRTFSHTLVRGEQSGNQELEYQLFDDDIGLGDAPHTHSFAHNFSNSGPRIPKSDFPTFDGDNPKWWKKSCEKYFKLYHV